MVEVEIVGIDANFSFAFDIKELDIPSTYEQDDILFEDQYQREWIYDRGSKRLHWNLNEKTSRRQLRCSKSDLQYLYALPMVDEFVIINQDTNHFEQVQQVDIINEVIITKTQQTYAWKDVSVWPCEKTELSSSFALSNNGQKKQDEQIDTFLLQTSLSTLQPSIDEIIETFQLNLMNQK